MAIGEPSPGAKDINVVTPVISTSQFHGCRYTAFGHSFGQVQNPVNVWAGSVYPARLKDSLFADSSLYVNRTVNGYKMSQIASSVSSNWTDGNGGLVTIMGNQNDVGNRTDATTFKNALQSALSTLLGSSGKPPTVLVIKDTTCTSVGYARYNPAPTDNDVATFNGYVDSVVAQFPSGWIYTVDLMAEGWNPYLMTAPDGQHPNDYGMSFITTACRKVLSAIPYRPGQNPGYATPLIATPPSAITLTGTPGNNQNTISISGGTGATSYALYRGTTATGTPIAAGFPYTDTGRTNGTAYNYIATATNAQGTVTSSSISVTPAASSSASISDSFNRADSTSVGSTDTGQAWSVLGDTNAAFGVSSNQLYKSVASSTTDDVLVIESGKSDFDMSITLSVVSGSTYGMGPVFRAASYSNYWMVEGTTQGYTLYKRVGGSFTSVQALSNVAAANGDVIRVVGAGSNIFVYKNGNQIGTTVSDTFNNTATKIGARFAGPTTGQYAIPSRLDVFSIA